MSEIIIEIESSTDASAYELGQIIHKNEFDTVCELIKDKIDFAKHNFERLANSSELEKNNTISVFGARGTGKTSFLKTIKQHYANNEIVEQLNLIDPTMIEEKGHIFLTVIAIINDKVLKKLKSKQTDSKVFKTWQETVNALAYGIPSIDGIGGNGLSEADWQDPEYIMQKGLTSVSVAFDLAKKFHLFLHEALSHLERKAFLIVFDDIDVNFRKGWPILEMIRKYFTSDLLITIVSGDIRLFSLSIRKHKWQNFGKALLINEGEQLKKMYYYNDRVTEMESQYLLKVLKPERRVQLSALRQKVYEINPTKKNDYYITYKDSESKEGIAETYNRILKQFGIVNSYQAESYKLFLLSQPIRTQIHFLSFFSPIDSTINPNNIILPFLSDLFEKEVNITLIENDPKFINIVILELLLKEKELEGAYQLMPSTKDESRNASLFALNLFSSYHLTKDPYQIFDYFIRVGYVRNLLSQFPYKEVESVGRQNPENPSIQDLCSHSGIFQDKVLRDIVGNINAYIGAFGSKSKSELGIISIEALSVKSKKSKTEDADRLDKILSNDSVSRIQEILGFMPLSINESSTSNTSSAVYSIFTLLGGIGELFRKHAANSLEKGLTELSQVRTYIMPDSKIKSNRPSEPIILNESVKSKNNDDVELLVNKFETWLKNFEKVKPIPIHLLGKVSTRLFYSLNAIERSERSERTTGLGTKMHRRIVALLNSVLYEDSIENISIGSRFNTNNPVKEDTIFISNLNAALQHRQNQRLTFSKWFLSCPILLCYLNPSSNIWGNLNDYIFKTEQEFLSQNNIFQLLENEKSSKVKTKPRKILRNQEVVNVLKNAKIPLFVFKKQKNREATIRANEIIRPIIKKLFNQDWGPVRIDSLRKYIIVNDLK